MDGHTPAMLYGSEYCPTRVTLVRKFEIAEMRMLRWMCGCTMLDRIPNRLYREKLGVIEMGEKLRGVITMIWTCPKKKTDGNS